MDNTRPYSPLHSRLSVLDKFLGYLPTGRNNVDLGVQYYRDPDLSAIS